MISDEIDLIFYIKIKLKLKAGRGQDKIVNSVTHCCFYMSEVIYVFL